MTPQISIVLYLLVIALILFSTERIPIEVVSLLLVMALVLTNTLTAAEAFAGFGNDIVLALGSNPRTFAVTVTYAASCSFLTPLEPACVLVYTPEGYRFLDFVKVGSIPTIAVFAIVIWLVPVFWPFQP